MQIFWDGYMKNEVNWTLGWCKEMAFAGMVNLIPVLTSLYHPVHVTSKGVEKDFFFTNHIILFSKVLSLILFVSVMQKFQHFLLRYIKFLIYIEQQNWCVCKREDNPVESWPEMFTAYCSKFIISFISSFMFDLFELTISQTHQRCYQTNFIQAQVKQISCDQNICTSEKGTTRWGGNIACLPAIQLLHEMELKHK